MRHKWFVSLAVALLTLLACNFSSTPEALSTATGPASPKAVDTPTVAPLPTDTPAPGATAVEPTPTVAAANPTSTTAPTPVPVVLPTNTPIVSGVPVTVTVLNMFSETAGWAVGLVQGNANDHLLRTTGGGSTWADVTPSGQTGGAITFFLNPQTAWAIYSSRDFPPTGSPVVWRTTDGGHTWAGSLPLDTTGAEYFAPSDLVFVNAQTGWLLGHAGAGMSHDYVMMFATADGGASWSKVVDPMDSTLAMTCAKTGMSFLNSNTGWVTGDCGGVVPGAPYFQQSMDGGKTWAAQTLPPPADASDLFTNENNACGTYSLVFTSATTGAVMMRCSDYSTNPAVLKSWLYTTADGGGTWTGRPLPIPYGSLDFAGPSVGYWLGSTGPDATGSELHQTHDGGQSWTLVRKVNWKQAELDFISEQVGWAVVHSGDAYALVKTANAGGKWAAVNPVITP